LVWVWSLTFPSLLHSWLLRTLNTIPCFLPHIDSLRLLVPNAPLLISYETPNRTPHFSLPPLPLFPLRLRRTYDSRGSRDYFDNRDVIFFFNTCVSREHRKSFCFSAPSLFWVCLRLPFGASLSDNQMLSSEVFYTGPEFLIPLHSPSMYEVF